MTLTAQDAAVTEATSVRRKASASSFYAAMCMLPRAEREAMYAIYAFCRAVDDIADDGGDTRAARSAKLDAWREDIEALYAGLPVALSGFLSNAVDSFGLRKEDFLAIIDGMVMDVAADIRGPDAASFDLYCERVASAVGRLCIKLFGVEGHEGFLLAHYLGRALQMTNVLRDLDEDAALGRLYVPREMLAEAGIRTRDPREAIADPAIDIACQSLSRLARENYRQADAILAARPKGRLRAPRLMSAVYAEILARMQTRGWKPPRERERIGKVRLLLLLLRHGLAP